MALRLAIEEQKNEFKDAHPVPSACPITGRPMKEPQIDHAPPNTFDNLMIRFVEHLGYVPDVHSPDGVVGKVLVDKYVEACWLAFHRTNANLRWVSKKANLSDIKKTRA